VEEVEGVGGGPAEGVLVEDLFGQGADQRLAAELAPVLFKDAGDDLVEMQGLAGLGEDGLNQSDAGSRWGQDLGALGGRAAEQVQGTELGMGGGFEDFEEILALEGGRILFHRVDNRRLYRYMSIVKYTYCYEKVAIRE
jgi:hypothetical protein